MKAGNTDLRTRWSSPWAERAIRSTPVIVEGQVNYPKLEDV